MLLDLLPLLTEAPTPVTDPTLSATGGISQPWPAALMPDLTPIINRREQEAVLVSLGIGV